MHSEHCLKCDRCVKDYQFHSKFFNKCIGDGNYKVYVFFVCLSYWFSFFLTTGFILQSSEFKNAQSSNLFYKMLEVHIMSVWNLNFEIFIPLYIIESYYYMLSGRCYIILSALSRNLTLQELEQPWQYKYLFKPETFASAMEKRTVYKMKHVSICVRLYYLFIFFFTCKKRPLKKEMSI
mmetsp:Transcript_8494/g.7849  ORF Transcript_8494/g.7849 Transcript_8494/m.7849 type:complete len:179 (-) Transcript_8494:118-654(-)